MPERWITALHTEDAGDELPAATRERLRDRFPRNATRRMTQLGITLGTTLQPLEPVETDAVIYATAYAETLALEGYLDSFPSPSPTLFQTSIHPSSVQQTLIQRQQPIGEFLPMAGGINLPALAIMAALISPASRVILCGGEERGGWLLEQGYASDRTFAFALALSDNPAGAIGRIALEPAGETAATALPLPAFFDLLQSRGAYDQTVLPGRRLILEWS